MSTLWLARHAGRVVSIEADQFWHTKLESILAAKKITNVDLRFEWSPSGCAPSPGWTTTPSISFSSMADRRAQCLIKRASGRSRRAVTSTSTIGMSRPSRAEEFLTAHHQEIVVRQSFVDYVPGNFAVNEGLFLQKSGQPCPLSSGRRGFARLGLRFAGGRSFVPIRAEAMIRCFPRVLPAATP